MKTMAGGKAAGIARWAWQDPPARAQQALDEIREMARSATGDELAEVQDSGTMLSRLVSSLEPQQAVAAANEDLISIQLAGVDTIISQVLELAGWKDSWRSERRGPHGEWIGGGGSDVGAGERSFMARQVRSNKLAADRAARLTAARQALDDQAAQRRSLMSTTVPVPDANKAQSIAAQAKAAAAAAPRQLTEAEAEAEIAKIPLLPGETKEMHLKPALPDETPHENLLHEQLLHQHVAPILEAKAEHILSNAKTMVEDKARQIEQAASTDEAKKAKLKAATEGSIAVASGILALILAAAGAPILATVAATVGPMLIQVIIEFFKKL